MNWRNGIFGASVRAYMTMVGTVIGAGIFGVPYVYAKGGAGLGLAYTIGLGCFLTLVCLIFAETLLRTKQNVRLPGLAKIYLGKRFGGIAAVSSIIGLWAALLAYFILGGNFLAILFGGYVDLPLAVWRIIFYALAGLVVAAGLQSVGRAEFWATGALLATLVYFLARLVPHAAFSNLTLVDSGNALLPYGVILFALSGVNAIPTIHDLLKRRERALFWVILIGSATAIFATAAFGLAVSGVTGVATSKDAITGLAGVLGPGVVKLGALFGLFAIATSFFSGGLYLRDIFKIDYRLGKTSSAAFALGVPVLAYFLGAADFIKVIGFAGVIFAAFDTALICLAFRAASRRHSRAPEFSLNAPNWVTGFIIALFAVGLALSLALA